MAKSRTEIQKQSDQKRGFITKTFKLREADATLITQSALALGIPQNEFIARAVHFYIEQLHQ